MFRNIFCLIDLEEDPGILDIACYLAEKLDATLHLLHVARIPPADMDVPVPFPANPRWEREAKAKLEKIARERVPDKVGYQIHVVSGVPDSEVVRRVNELGADLVVMTTHGRKGLSHFMLGSIAERVMREANCPVLTARRLDT